MGAATVTMWLVHHHPVLTCAGYWWSTSVQHCPSLNTYSISTVYSMSIVCKWEIWRSFREVCCLLLWRVKLKPKHVPEFQELNMTQVFSEHVCRVVISIDEWQVDNFALYNLSNVVIADVDVFESLLSHWVGRNEDWSLIIPADRDWPKLVANLSQ